MNVVPCDFKLVRNVNGVKIGYRVSLHILLVWNHGEIESHAFLRISSALDNAELARECGLPCCLLSNSVIVTESHFSELYQLIEDYVSSTDPNR